MAIPLLADPLLGIAFEPRQLATELFQLPDDFRAAGTEEFLGNARLTKRLRSPAEA